MGRRLKPWPVQITPGGDRMKKESTSPRLSSQPADDSHVTRAEPEWICKVLSLAERVTSDSPTSLLAEKCISQHKQP